MKTVVSTTLAFAALLGVAVTTALPAAAEPEHRPAVCTVPNRPAAIVRADAPDYPAIAQAQGLTGTSIVRVDLSPSGSVDGAWIHKSSGSSVLDSAAIRAAKTIVYTPAIQDCANVGGSYAVEIAFPE